MNEQEKELAIKIFDYFFKKVGVNSIIIPDITETLWFKLRLNRYLLNKYSSYFVTNDIECCYKDHSIFKKYARNNRVFSLENFPRDLKAKVVHACVSFAQSLALPFHVKIKTIVVIPKAKSLEELAIKMELES